MVMRKDDSFADVASVTRGWLFDIVVGCVPLGLSQALY